MLRLKRNYNGEILASTVVDALTKMQQFVRDRPPGFIASIGRAGESGSNETADRRPAPYLPGNGPDFILPHFRAQEPIEPYRPLGYLRVPRLVFPPLLLFDARFPGRLQRKSHG